MINNMTIITISTIINVNWYNWIGIAWNYKENWIKNDFYHHYAYYWWLITLLLLLLVLLLTLIDIIELVLLGIIKKIELKMIFIIITRTIDD